MPTSFPIFFFANAFRRLLRHQDETEQNGGGSCDPDIEESDVKRVEFRENQFQSEISDQDSGPPLEVTQDVENSNEEWSSSFVSKKLTVGDNHSGATCECNADEDDDKIVNADEDDDQV